MNPIVGTFLIFCVLILLPIFVLPSAVILIIDLIFGTPGRERDYDLLKKHPPEFLRSYPTELRVTEAGTSISSKDATCE